ncbi:cytochrome c oxidase subunit 3 [Sphingomonas cannabina]|uniref:cytochrome c oxidase subunit 3 n=1 Tax=Sphingomonas cannabina TaxID=2899123 RepID=UPI001F276316|nr:cytochrome c oxidase subunit 3 [Sphingomonas cannabina]UIJ44840.1 cytochrome c oxidase subunit 3 [Sphingomonas cannabina]
MSDTRFVGDAASLPDHGFGTRSATWWGVAGFIAIEAAGFALAFAAYFYLMAQEKQWPSSALPPDLLWGTATLVLLLLSEIPNVWVKRAAQAEDLGKVRIGLAIMSLIVLPVFVTRGIEFDHLNIGWDRNAYGSITWALLLMHTVHLITDWVDTLVLTALMHTRHAHKGRRFVDTSENALYWHFIVLSWVLVYAMVYWAPRLTA